MKPSILILLGINLLAFLQITIDKWLAIANKRRIPEIQLILPTLLGGFPGILLGMILLRHKTKKRSFQMKLLFVLIVFAGIVYYFTTTMQGDP